MPGTEADSGLGPLQTGQRVAVVGGGPAGTSCAITLRRQGRALGRDIDVVLFEARNFDEDSNVCVAVLSPPFGHLLAGLGLSLPPSLVQREIDKYVLHTDGESLDLPNPVNASEPTLAVRRIDLDQYLLTEAREAGVRVRQQAVMEFRFEEGAARLRANGGEWESYDAIVCAFGLSSQTLKALEAATEYRRPPLMRAVLTHLPVGREAVDARIGGNIHALLPDAQPQIEFAALTPKDVYVTVNAAGPSITDRDLESVIAEFQAHALLPAEIPPSRRFHSVFPSGPARTFYADRMVVVGNASGMLRPLKGKGLSAALQTGTRAAKVMLEDGISAEAFNRYHKLNEDITSDYHYGMFLRRLYHLSRFLGYLDPVIHLAKSEPTLYRVFHAIVSGEGSYRQAVHSLLKPTLWLRIAGAVAAFERRRRLPGRVKPT